MNRIHRLLVTSGFYPSLICSLLACSMLFARWWWVRTPALLFMVWNLFLAWLPWLFSLPMRALPSPAPKGHGWKSVPWFLAWLAFLPNAPYMVTDLLHLPRVSGAPLWFDSAMLFTFAWTGCLLGFHSLRAVHLRMENWLGRAVGWLFVAGSALLCGFGIYLGRFLRWNSWDVMTRPGELGSDIVQRVIDPRHHIDTWAVTLLFAAFMLAAYSSVVPWSALPQRAPDNSTR